MMEAPFCSWKLFKTGIECIHKIPQVGWIKFSIYIWTKKILSPIKEFLGQVFITPMVNIFSFEFDYSSLGSEKQSSDDHMSQEESEEQQVADVEGAQEQSPD
jgi:hypothetical protein